MDSRTGKSVEDTKTYLFGFYRFETYDPFIPHRLLIGCFRYRGPVTAIIRVLHTPLRRAVSQFDHFLNHQAVELCLPGKSENDVRGFGSVSAGKISFLIVVRQELRTEFTSASVRCFHLGLSQQIVSEGFIQSLLQQGSMK